MGKPQPFFLNIFEGVEPCRFYKLKNSKRFVLQIIYKFHFFNLLYYYNDFFNKTISILKSWNINTL